MITRIGTASDLKDLFYQYMDFLTSYHIDSSGDIDSWLILDPRLDSFYGATVAVPVGEYEKRDEEVKIWIDKNAPSIWHKSDTTFYDSIIPGNGIYNNLFEVLNSVYHNGIVKFTNTYGGDSLKSMYELLMSTPSDELPDIVISFGVNAYVLKDLDIEGAEHWTSDIEVELNNLFTFCASNNIKLYCCAYFDGTEALALLYDDVYNAIESFVSVTGERLINLQSNFVDMFGDLYTLVLEFPTYSASCIYTDVAVRRLLQEFMHIERPEYFISFQYRSINSNSYREFLYNYSDYQSEEFDKTEYGKRSISSKNNARNPFKNSGQFVAVGIHTSYDYNLWMCEQGGITCKKEADKQINDIDLLPFWQFYNGYPQKRRDIPIYPGTGCPWFTVANTDISRYGINSVDNPIHYYFTKDNISSTITIRFCDINFTYPDYWQNIVLGRFTHTKDEIYPFYVGGGNLALYPDWWLYYTKIHTYGQMYNLTLRNPALCNSNILHTTKFGKANLSNFRVMSPDGFWKDIYSAYQTYKDIKYFIFLGYDDMVDEWGECVLEHTYDYDLNTGAELVDTRGKIGLLDINKDSDDINKAYDKYFEKTNLDNITVQINASDGVSNSLSYGSISGVYASWSRNLEQGLHSVGGKYWLAIPNGWQDRLWHYKFYYGRIYWEGKNEQSRYPITERGLEQLEYVRDEYHTLTEGRYNNKMINDKLVISFGNGQVECSDLHIDFPDDYMTEKETNVLVRALIHAEADLVGFQIYPIIKGIVYSYIDDYKSNIESCYVTVDFGDGTVERFSSDDRIQHKYESVGDFYINIYIGNNIGNRPCLYYDGDFYDTLDDQERSIRQPNKGFVFSDDGVGSLFAENSRNDILKELYISPYYSQPLWWYHSIQFAQAPRFMHDLGIWPFTLFSQYSLTKLYLPSMYNTLEPSCGINSNTWYAPVQINDCVNITDIYIFNDFVSNMDVKKNRDKVAILDIRERTPRRLNVYISDGISHVFINTNAINIYTFPLLSVSQWCVVDLYLYNKSLVNISNYAFYDHNLDVGEGGKVLHVPAQLLSDYQKVYGDWDRIIDIIGDIV